MAGSLISDWLPAIQFDLQMLFSATGHRNCCIHGFYPDLHKFHNVHRTLCIRHALMDRTTYNICIFPNFHSWYYLL